MSFFDLFNFNTESSSNAAGTGSLKTSVSSDADKSVVSQKNIFYTMTKEQAQKLGMVDEFLRADTDGSGEISEDEFVYYKASSESLIDKSAIDKLSSMSQKEKTEYMKQQISKYIDMSRADEKFNGMDIAEALKAIGITQELLDANGLTIEKIKGNPEELGKLLYNQLNERYENDINNKDGETWQTEYQRLKNGEYTDYEKNVLGLSGELTEEQLEIYAKQAIKQKYMATMATIITSSDINTDDEEKMAYFAGVMQGMKDSFFENDKKAYLIAMGLTRMAESKNIYTESTASKIAENAEAYGIFDGDSETSVLVTAVIVQTASPEAIEKFIVSNPEHADLIKQVAENVISSMPDSARKDALQKTLKSALAKVESETKTSSSKDTKTVSSASAEDNSQNITEVQIMPPPQIFANTESISVTNPNNVQTNQSASDMLVSSLSVKKSVPEIYIQSLDGIVGDIKDFKKGSLKDGLEELVELYNDNKGTVGGIVKKIFAFLKSEQRAEMFIFGTDSMRSFLKEQNFLAIEELSDYCNKEDLLKKLKDTDGNACELVIDFRKKHNKEYETA